MTLEFSPFSAEAVSISYKPYVKHLFNLHKKLLFPNYRRETCHTSPCPTPPQPHPTFILTILSPSLIPSSFHPLLCCLFPSILAALIQPSFFPLPGLTGLPASGHLLVTFKQPPRLSRVHTHICYISSPFPLEHCVQPTVCGFPEQLHSTPTCCFLAAHCCVRQARLDSALQGLGCHSAHAPPLSQPQAFLPHFKAEMKRHHLFDALLISLFLCKTAFDNRYFCPPCVVAGYLHISTSPGSHVL